MNYQKNIEIINGLEKAVKRIAGEGPFTCEIKGSDGKLTKVSKEEFARWMVNERNKDSWVGGVFSVGKNSEIEEQNKAITPALPSNLQSEKDNSQIEANFPAGVEEEFGYYKQWEGWSKPLTEHTNTAYYWKKEGKNYFEKKVVWKDNEEVEGIKVGENFSISDKIKEDKSEVSQKVFSSKPDNKDNSNKNIYYGVGFISLVLLLISMAVVRMKKKK